MLDNVGNYNFNADVPRSNPDEVTKNKNKTILRMMISNQNPFFWQNINT